MSAQSRGGGRASEEEVRVDRRLLTLVPLCRGAHIDVRNKKGNTPLWLAANGGHFDVVQLLVHASADVDAADNRKITPLMAAFRKVQSRCRPEPLCNVPSLTTATDNFA